MTAEQRLAAVLALLRRSVSGRPAGRERAPICEPGTGRPGLAEDVGQSARESRPIDVQ